MRPPAQRARGTDPARRVAFDVLRTVAEQDAYANLVLPQRIRVARLSGRDAALATELAYGTLRGRGLYDAVIAACTDRPLDDVDPPVLDALRMGVHQVLATRVPDHAAVDQTVALVRSVRGQGAAGFTNAVMRQVARQDLASWTAQVAPERAVDPVAHWAVAHSHPGWVVRALRESLAAHGRPVEEIEDLLLADNTSPSVSLVSLPGVADEATTQELADRVGPGRWSPVGSVLLAGDPGGLGAVREGRVRVQDEGSQLAALLLTEVPLEGEDRSWLDLCAGPGGKAALLAAVGAGRGAVLTAVEVAEHRAALVRQALAPVPGQHEVRVGDGRSVGGLEPGAYDRVLVDAPCTGLGALRRRPEARWRRQPSDLAALGPLQRELLASAVEAVRPGGVVAYVTCSPHPAETVMVVSDLLRAREDVELLDAVPVLDEVVGRAVPDAGSVLPGGRAAATDAAGTAGRPVQLWPHRHGTDAMFIALLRRQ